MLRSGLLCLAWLLTSSSALAQPAANPAAPVPAPAAPAQTAVQNPKVVPAPQAATSPQQTTPPHAATAPGASPNPSSAADPGSDAARKVRLRVTVDVIDPSRDVRDIISELRTRRRDGAAPGAPGKGQPLRERAPGAARELREVRSERRELRRERRDVRNERLEERQKDKAPQGGRLLRASERKGGR